VVKLDERRVLEHVAPPKIRLIWDVAVKGIEKFLLGWSETKTHPWELVVDQTSIETSNQGT
jgi:hypothetical protein